MKLLPIEALRGLAGKVPACRVPALAVGFDLDKVQFACGGRGLGVEARGGVGGGGVVEDAVADGKI